MPSPYRLACVFILSCLLTQLAGAQFYVSHLKYLSRSGAQVGSPIELSVHGDRLDEVSELQFSNSAITATVKTVDPLPFTKDRLPQYGHFTVQVPSHTPPGRYEVRALGRHGLSNPLAFLVSELANQVIAPASHDPSSPTKLAGRPLIHAVATAKATDWFEFDVAAGEKLSIYLLAQQVDSALIGQLELFGPDGQRLSRRRGADDFDPRLTIDQPQPGKYRLAVRDFLYRGGPEFFYQICISDQPPAFSAETPTSGQLAEHWLPRAATLAEPVSLGTKEIEQQQEPSKVDPPAELYRWFPSGAEDHIYELSAKQGEKFAIDIVSQRIGQPTDPRLVIDRMEPQSEGETKLHHVAHFDDGPNITDGQISLLSKDPNTVFTAPAEASYRLVVRDLDIGTSLLASQQYLLRIREPRPRFDLVAFRHFPARDPNTATPFATKLFRGGTAIIRVFAVRHDGWSGPIEVTVEGLPDGVTCRQAVIAANQDRTQLALVAAENAKSQNCTLKVVGTAADNQTSAATPVAITRARGHGRGAARTRIVASLPLHVSEQDLSPLTLNLGDQAATDVKVGETLALPIRVIRREGGKTPCLFRPQNLPPGITAGEVTVAADATEGKIELKLDANAKPGSYSIWLQAETKIKIRPNPQALQRAQDYRKMLQALHDDPAQAGNLDAIKAAIQSADQLAEAAKPQANEQELTVFLPTNHTTIRVVQP